MNENIENIPVDELKILANNSGKILKEGFYSSDKEIEKKDDRELVTKYDFKSENYLIKMLSKYFPVLSEEKNQNIDKDKIFWVIDPLDGTNNFSFNIPHFCVTFALIKNKKVIFGIVYDPIKNEMFYAVKDKGAFLNDKKIKVSERKKLSQAMVATGFAYNRKENNYNNIDNFSNMVLKVKGIRRLGAAALDLCYVAAGRYDAYWETNLNLWDMAAGKLILQEAGGKVTGLNGQIWKISNSHILASNSYIHEMMLNNLQKYG